MGLLQHAKFGQDQSRGVGTGAPKIGYICVVMSGYTYYNMLIKMKFGIKESTPWIRPRMPNLAQIGEGEDAEVPKLENLVKIEILVGFGTCLPFILSLIHI